MALLSKSTKGTRDWRLLSNQPNNKGGSVNQKLICQNVNDVDGNPAGGAVDAIGISINFQNGPLGRGADRKEPNGAFVAGVIAAAIQRIQYYQDSKFKCRENAIALTHLETALLWLNKRTADREARDVEGTHQA